METLIFNHRSVQWSVGKISIFPSKEVQERNQYTQETCPGGGPGGPGNLFGDPGKLTRHKEELHSPSTFVNQSLLKYQYFHQNMVQETI